MILNLRIGDRFKPAGYNRTLQVVHVDERSGEPGDAVYDAVDEQGDAWAIVDDFAVLVRSGDDTNWGGTGRSVATSVFDSMGGAV